MEKSAKLTKGPPGGGGLLRDLTEGILHIVKNMQNALGGSGWPAGDSFLFDGPGASRPRFCNGHIERPCKIQLCMTPRWGHCTIPDSTGTFGAGQKQAQGPVKRRKAALLALRPPQAAHGGREETTPPPRKARQRTPYPCVTSLIHFLP